MSGPVSQLLANCALFVLLALIGIVLARGRVRWSWLAIALGLFIIQDMALSSGWGALSGLDLIDSRWNWEGRLLSTLVLIGLALLLFRHDWEATGLRLGQSGPAAWLALVLSLVVCALFAAGAYWLVPGPLVFAPEDIAFQATMPGIEEEIFYRGLLLGALDRAFGTPLKLLRAPMGWGAVATAMLFAAAHAVVLTPELAMTLDIGQSAWLFAAGLVLAWLRAATGSILLPVIVHNWANASVYVL